MSIFHITQHMFSFFMKHNFQSHQTNCSKLKMILLLLR